MLCDELSCFSGCGIGGGGESSEERQGRSSATPEAAVSSLPLLGRSAPSSSAVRAYRAQLEAARRTAVGEREQSGAADVWVN